MSGSAAEALYQKWLLEVRGKLSQLNGTAGVALIGTAVATDTILRNLYASLYNSGQAAAFVILSTVTGADPGPFIPHALLTNNPHKVTAGQILPTKRIPLTGNTLITAADHKSCLLYWRGTTDITVTWPVLPAGFADMEGVLIERAGTGNIFFAGGTTGGVSQPNDLTKVSTGGIVQGRAVIPVAANGETFTAYWRFRGEMSPT